MGNFSINQKNFKNQNIKTIHDFDSFDSVIDWDVVYTSYLNKGQCSTEKDMCTLIVSILFPVMAGLKSRK